jgi:ubiquinone/menaquinone biosynthesis C-methylase UbiE
MNGRSSARRDLLRKLESRSSPAFSAPAGVAAYLFLGITADGIPFLIERDFLDGKAYERLMGRWSRLIGEKFLDWLDAPRNIRWLDVGCGNGAFTEELIARCAPAAVTAIDSCDDQLAFARTRAGASMADFRIGDAQKLPFADNTFDAAAMALVISFLPDPVRAVAEMARVVRPNGLVATYMWDIPGGGLPVHPIYVVLEAMGIKSGRSPNFSASERTAMQVLWENAGLESIETRVIRISTVYSDFDDFWNSNVVPIGPQGKIVAGMPPGKRDELRLRLRDHLPAGPNGRIIYEAFANSVKGRVPA